MKEVGAGHNLLVLQYPKDRDLLVCHRPLRLPSNCRIWRVR